MEGMNPFWWSALPLSAWIGGVGLVLSLLAGLLWLIRRSRGPLILFLALLIFTAMAGLTYVMTIALVGPTSLVYSVGTKYAWRVRSRSTASSSIMLP